MPAIPEGAKSNHGLKKTAEIKKSKRKPEKKIPIRCWGLVPRFCLAENEGDTA